MERWKRKVPGARSRSGKYGKKRAWIYVMFCLGIFFGKGKIAVNAEPVSLQSESAVIYSGMDEAGDAVGNLVRGSSFELLDRMTAEDGSSWYHVSAFGVEGYIRGSAEIEGGETEPAGTNEPPDGSAEAVQTGAGVNAAGENAGAAQTGTGADATENGMGVAAGENAAAKAGEDIRQEETAGEETGADGEMQTGISGNSAGGFQGINTREKTYAGSDHRIKNMGMEDMPNDEEGGRECTGDAAAAPAIKVNITILFFVAATAGSILTALVSYKLLKRELSGRERADRERPGLRGTAGDKKTIRRKKKHKRKKGKSKKNGNTKK